ncbi:mitochondrial carrier, partial [Cyberlindnera jadinii NRRL Y-1542]
NLVTAVIAGVSASLVQTTLTYPFEFAKTVSQLTRRIPNSKGVLPSLELHHQFKHYFAGCGALNVGNALKSGSRFMVFNWASKFMASDTGKTSAPRLVIAGAMTGFVESLWIIPFENIKTTMIESALITSAHLSNHPMVVAKRKWDKNPPANFLQATQEIYQTRGFRGFVQGTVPTLLRQCTNSAVRFGTYTWLRSLFGHSGEMNTYLTFTIGVTSSVVVVAVTQPIDVIKTRMQSRETFYLYKNSLNCAYRIFVEEGVKAFWAGWFPRLLKVGTSGGVAFTVYQHVENQITRALKEKPFQAD